MDGHAKTISHGYRGVFRTREWVGMAYVCRCLSAIGNGRSCHDVLASSFPQLGSLWEGWAKCGLMMTTQFPRQSDGLCRL